MFTFVQHPRGAFLEVRLSGFWTREESAQFGREFAPNIAEFRRRFGAFRMLADAREFAVQADYVVESAIQSEGLLLAQEDDRIAFVVASALLGMQVRRLHTDPRISVFTSADAARTWLAAA